MELVASRTACACTEAFENHVAAPAYLPILEMQMPADNMSLSEKITATIEHQEEPSVCPNLLCENDFTTIHKHVFITAPDVLIVSVQRRMFDASTLKSRKDQRPINVGGNLKIALKEGTQVEYEAVAGIEHFGSYDQGGHYFTVVRHEGQFLIVNQEAKISPARNGLRNCQIFMYRKVPNNEGVPIFV